MQQQASFRIIVEQTDSLFQINDWDWCTLRASSSGLKIKVYIILKFQAVSLWDQYTKSHPMKTSTASV